MKSRLQTGVSSDLKKRIKEEFEKLLERYNCDAALQILCILHFDYGFGEKRLTDFAKKLTEMQAQYREFYEMEDDDIPFICEHKLKEAGIDVKKMLDK